MNKRKLLLLAVPMLLSSCCFTKRRVVTIVEEQSQTQTTSAEMRVQDGYIQYKNDDGVWVNVIALEDIKGEPGQQGELNEVTIVDAYITTQIDVVSLKTNILHLVKSDGTTQTIQLSKEPVECFYDFDSGDNQCLGYLPASKDGLPHGRLRYEVYFHDFLGSSSSLTLTFDVDPNDITGGINYSKAGRYDVTYKRFDGKNMSGYIYIYYDEPDLVDSDNRLLQHYIPKTSSPSEIPDLYTYWWTANDEYRYYKFKDEELAGIDFSTVGEKEITYVFDTIYGKKEMLNDNTFTVYDPANITRTQTYFDVGYSGGGALNSPYEYGKMATIGYAYNSARQGENIFHTGQYIYYKYSDGKEERNFLTLDEFVETDVQALKAVTSDSTVQLHFKDNTACYIEVVCRQEEAFDTLATYYYSEVYLTKVGNEYVPYQTPKAGYKDLATDAVCYFDYDLNDLLNNPENELNFKEGMPKTFDNLVSKDGNFFKTYDGDYFIIYIYDELVNIETIADINGSYCELYMEKGKELPEEMFTIDMLFCDGFRIVEEDYTYTTYGNQEYLYDYCIPVSTDDFIAEKSELNTDTLGFHNLVFDSHKYGEIRWAFSVYDPNVALYFAEGEIGGDIPFISGGSCPSLTVPYGTPASEIAPKLVGLYMRVCSRDHFIEEKVLITGDMIRTETYDPYDVDDQYNYILIYYMGAYVAVQIDVEEPYEPASLHEVTILDETTELLLEESLYIDIKETDTLYINDFNKLYHNSDCVGRVRKFKDIDENSYIATLEDDKCACSFILTWDGDNVTISSLTPEFLGDPIKEGEVNDAEYGEHFYVKLYACGVCEVIFEQESKSFDLFWQYVDYGNGTYIAACYNEIVFCDCGTYFVAYYASH